MKNGMTLHFILYLIKEMKGICVHLWLLLLLVGCVPLRNGVPDNGVPATPEESVQNAQFYLGSRPNWDTDCSHFVLACYHSPRMRSFLSRRTDHHNLTRELRDYLSDQGRRRRRAEDIRPGDILIFNFTYDINRDGRIDSKDLFTHAGIAEKLENGLVVYLDASERRKPPRLRRRSFSLFGEGHNEVVATDPATGRKIRHRETFDSAFEPPQ